MANAFNGAPLIFLTTYNASSPSGRNARAQARSQSARLTNPLSKARGTFGSFNLDLARAGTADADRQPPLKRRKPRIVGEDVVDQATAFQSGLPSPVRVLSTHFTTNVVLPPNVDLDSVLQVAAFHIRRQAAQMIETNPDRILDALRWRQWAHVSSAYALLGRSSYLDCAIACVVAKVAQVISGSSPLQRTLWCYAEALNSLRAAVMQPNLHSGLDLLAATQLLAIYEMLDDTDNDRWMQHVAGAAAMAKMHDVSASDSSFSASPGQAAPIFVEALLNDDESFFDSQHWQRLLHFIVVKQYPSSDLSEETIECLVTLKTLFAAAKPALHNTDEGPGSRRWPLLSSAHELRLRMRALIIESEQRLRQRRWCSNSCDVLGLFLVGVMMLDKLIQTLRPHSRGHELEEDTQELCTQMIRFERVVYEADPGEELLLAFQHQMRFPMLTCNT